MRGPGGSAVGSCPWCRSSPTSRSSSWSLSSCLAADGFFAHAIPISVRLVSPPVPAQSPPSGFSVRRHSFLRLSFRTLHIVGYTVVVGPYPPQVPYTHLHRWTCCAVEIKYVHVRNQIILVVNGIETVSVSPRMMHMSGRISSLVTGVTGLERYIVLCYFTVLVSHSPCFISMRY